MVSFHTFKKYSYTGLKEYTGFVAISKRETWYVFVYYSQNQIPVYWNRYLICLKYKADSNKKYTVDF